MKYDKISIAGIATCVVLMVLLFIRMNSRVAQQKQAGDNTPAAVVAQNEAVQPKTDATMVNAEAEKKAEAVQAATGIKAPAGSVELASTTAAPADPLLPVAAAARRKSEKKPIELTRPDESVVRIDPCGAGVVGVEMIKYARQPVGKEVPGPVVLGHYDYPFLALSSMEGVMALQAADEQNVSVDSENGTASVVRMSADGKYSVTETWSLPSDAKYEIGYTVTFKNISAVDCIVKGLGIEVGALSPFMAGPGEVGFGGVAYMQPGESHCTMWAKGDLDKAGKARLTLADANSTEKEQENAKDSLKRASDVLWACVHTRYFTQAVRSCDKGFKFPYMEAFSCEGMPEDADKKPLERFRSRLALPAVELAAGAEQTFEFTGYAGPMDLNILSDKKIGLEGILGVDRFFWGSPAWMGSLSKFFLNSLLYLSRLFPGKQAIGLALILLTIIVKAVFWPLSYKSTKSMKKMQELQPQLKELREKYKSDPQEMYRRQQELFKANHVSQFGGCLPMLVQIPIFFALFNTFRGSIELRQACFLWASDLSLPDTVLSLGPIPVNPFAIVMAVAMIWQQNSMPSGDPSQKRMMMMMSLVFTYFLYSQPSGLTLYMTVNMFLSMLQTYLIKKLEQKGSKKPVLKPTGKVQR